MNSSLGNDEDGQKIQPDEPVEIIPYNLLKKSSTIREGVSTWANEYIFKPTNERRALKLLPLKPKEWFKNELAAAFRLNHENIIKIYGQTLIIGILTEWVEGRSLKEIIHDQSISYTLADVLLWNIQSFRALEYIQSFTGKENEHFRRNFNRTVCAENMILNPAQNVLKICALGLFKEIPDSQDFNPQEHDEDSPYDMDLPDLREELNCIRQKIDFSYYWAPEVWNGEYRNDESDVYPFGVVLWECITRKKPMIWPRRKEVLLASIECAGSGFGATSMFKRFIDGCTLKEPSEDRLSASVIKNILENMVPAEKEQISYILKDNIISFWNDNELFYCKKLISFEYSRRHYADKTVKRNPTIFNYSSLQETLKLLGGGSFGQVWSAEYEDKKIAVKFQGAMKMYPFMQEFDVLNRLKHDNIVKVIGQTEEQGVYGVVMEFIDGTSLDKIIYESPKKYTLGDVLTWNYQAASALEYMHSFRFLHRDVKPDNMLIENSEQRTLKIVDLGGAKKIQNSLNFTGMGTELYIAPEIDNNDHYDEQCDVYSWAITFWECCTAERPLKPLDYRSKINQICSTKFVEVVEKCSSSEPSDRKPMFVIKKWLGDMLKHQKTFTDTDSTFRENHICVWNEQTNELYYFAKTESDQRFQNALTEAKTSFVNVSMDAIKIIRDLGDKSGNVKYIKVTGCKCENEVALENSQSVTHEAVDEPGTRYRKCSRCELNFSRRKILKFSKNADEHLENEFLILSKLKHKNIIQLFGYTHDNELNCFGIITNVVKSYETLEKVITSGYCPIERIVQWSWQSARGLEYMHSQNILHCDIKPANIVTNSSGCKISGFDLSRDLQFEHPNKPVGTRIYMAPEVMRDGLVTTKSDVYSWTVTFWILCLRQNIKPADDSKFEAIRQMESIDLSETGKGYKIEKASEKLNDFIQTCANVDPDKRLSMTDIATLLENMLKNNSNSCYVPDFDNIETDVVVQDNICLWTKSKWRELTKKDFFYASADLEVNLISEDSIPGTSSKESEKLEFLDSNFGDFSICAVNRSSSVSSSSSLSSSSSISSYASFFSSSTENPDSATSDDGMQDLLVEEMLDQLHNQDWDVESCSSVR